jgi:hypothetical protein
LFIDLCEDLEHIGWQGTELERMQMKLKQDCQTVIEPDVEKWSGYVTRPSAIIRTSLPSHLSFLRPLIEQEKTYLLDSMNADGTWNLSWDWGQFPEQFAVAKNWWKAILVIQYHQFMAV